MAYYHGLLYEKCPAVVVEKMRMLRTGEYKGVRLFDHGWDMSRGKMYALMKVYRREFVGHYWYF